MAALLNFWNSPNKQNGTSADPRGTKRKAKADPYEPMEEDDEDDIIPARKTPTSQRTARSRLSSTTPGSSTRPRISVTGKRPRGRPSLKSQQGDASSVAVASQIHAEVNTAGAKAPETKPMQLDSLVPEAPMGGLATVPQPETVNEPTPKNKGKAKQIEAMATEQARGKEAEVEVEEKEEENEEEEEGEDVREEHEIAKLLKHRMTSDQSGAVELLIQWMGEGEQDATWELEEEVQHGAEDALYDYWKAQGGRINALFHKPKNPPPETYHVFKVLRHEKKNRGGFQFEVQWVGHPATRGETTMEAESKLKNISPTLLEEYWESVGGRTNHLAPRGRGKRARTE